VSSVEADWGPRRAVGAYGNKESSRNIPAQVLTTVLGKSVRIKNIRYELLLPLVLGGYQSRQIFFRPLGRGYHVVSESDYNEGTSCVK